MKMKLTAVFLTVTLLFNLAGCGHAENNASAAAATTLKAAQTTAVMEATTLKAKPQNSGIWYNDQITNILLAGYDYGNRSDALLIISINKINKIINVISLPRATYVAIPGHGHERINAAYSFGGPELLKKTIEQNYKIRIDHYVCTGFEGFTKIIDSLGGLTVYWTQKELDFEKVLLTAKGINTSSGAGNYTIDGQTALAFARMRKLDSDKNRTARHRRVILALIAKLKSSSAPEIIKLLHEFLPNVSTDFTATELVSQAADALTYAHWQVRQTSIPFQGTSLVKVNGYEVLKFNWNTVRADIHKQLYSGITVSAQ